MSQPSAPLHDRVRSDLSEAMDAGRLDATTVAGWLTELGHGKVPGSLGEHEAGDVDAVVRLAWLLFVRAAALDGRYVALAPMNVAFLGSGQRSVGELLDELVKLEAASDGGGSTDEAVQAVLSETGDALVQRVLARTGGEAAEERLSAMNDYVRAKVRERVASGRWEQVPLPGPDAPRVRRALASLPPDTALTVYDAWSRAEALASQEDYAGAVQALKPAADAAPHLFETYVRRANYRFGQQDRVGAGADLERALSMEPDAAAARAMRAELRAITRDMKGSMADWDAAVAAAPDHVAFRVGRGYTRLALGDLDGALADFTEAVERAPEDTTPLYNRADAYVRKGDLDAAAADYDRILELTPDDVAARMNRGTVHLMRHDTEAAIADFSGALERRPTHTNAYAKRGASWFRAGKPWWAWLDGLTALALAEPDWSHREQMEQLLRQAHTQFAKGTEGASPSPDDVRERYDEVKRRATGVEVLRFAEVLGDHLPEEGLTYHLLRADAFLTYGRWEAAAQACREALAVDDDAGAAWLGLGRASLFLNQLDVAVDALDKAASRAHQLDEAGTFALHLARGRAAGTQRRFDDALAAFDEALGLRPDRADVWFYKGVHLDLAGRREDALTAYDKSIARDGSFAPAWFNRACEYAILGHREGALSDLKRAIALDGDFAEAARTDTYFKALWQDPAFLEVVGASA